MSVFKFKQFSVIQEKSPLRLTTDSVLIGVLAKTDSPKTIIDIGTGTGVIALIMAQENPEAKIWGIDNDQLAYTEAKTNFKNSPWAKNLTAIHSSFQDYAPTEKLDCIISNPPFFSESTEPTDRKKHAKHRDKGFFPELVNFSSENLSPTGTLHLVLPYLEYPEFESRCIEKNLHASELWIVRAKKNNQPIRVICTVKRDEQKNTVKQLVIHNDNGSYTKEYIAYTKEYYLNF